MYYEINVAHEGRHFFATSKRSITDIAKLKRVYDKFRRAFPKSEGYELRITYWEHRGHTVSPKTFKKVQCSDGACDI